MPVSGTTPCSFDQSHVVCSGEPTFPGTELLGDGLDNDCDGETDEAPVPIGCGDEVERCGDGLDNDCDGEVDEGFASLGLPCSIQGACTYWGTFSCEPGVDTQLTCSGGNGVSSSPEICDGLDNDCDGDGRGIWRWRTL